MDKLKEYLTLDNVKKALALGICLAVAVALYFAVPGSFVAVLLAQLLAIAVVGAGGKKLSRAAISLVVFVVAGIVAYTQVNGAFPAFPVYGGDIAVYVAAAFVWIQAFSAFAAPIVGAAMLQYNLILETVLKLIGGQVGLRFEPK